MSTDELLLRSIRDLVADFEPGYWREHDQAGTLPHEFYDALAENGWLGMMVSEAYGGEGLGLEPTADVVRECARAGAGATTNIFAITTTMTTVAIEKFGDEQLKQSYLPGMVDGEYLCSWGITEPEAGSNTFATSTRAVRDGDEYVLDGQKIWTTFAHESNLMVVVARTTPLAEVDRKHEGLTLFIVNPETASISISPIEKMSIRATPSNEVFLDDVRVPESAVIGEVDSGWEVLREILHVERMTTGATCVGTGFLALDEAVAYAKDREVFGNRIGSYQGIQHPLAEAKMNLEMADTMVGKATRGYDGNDEYELAANIGGLKAAEFAFEAADTAIEVLGGMGVAKESDVERHFRDMKLFRQAPLTPQLAKNFIAKKYLDLPRS